MKRNHYYLTFPPFELIEVGFNKSELYKLSQICSDQFIKFHIYWDQYETPQFCFKKGDPIIEFNSSPGSFYRDFVTWVLRVTGVKAYRVIHMGGMINVLFDHASTEVNPQKNFSDYDFSGFYPYTKVYPDGRTRNFWNISPGLKSPLTEVIPDNPVLHRPNTYRHD